MTTRHTHRLRLDEPAIYEIQVQGRLDAAWSAWLGGMTLTSASEDAGPTITTLTGKVADQAALQGLLRRLHGLGLPLLSVRYLAPVPTIASQA
ncbi:MAG: hypothetical protein GYB67_07130 [Chloroflexi bacterium]|nr:hypothetical protein [Chloroflexota bacterium]